MLFDLFRVPLVYLRHLIPSIFLRMEKLVQFCVYGLCVAIL